MILADTIENMISEDYKKRLLAEYHQIEIRYYGLKEMIRKAENNELNFNLKVPIEMHKMQLEYMYKYMAILKSRLIIEEVI